MVTQIKHLQAEAQQELEEHSFIKALLTKWGKDNVGMLSAFVSWSVLTSLVPIMVGLVAISTLFLRDPSTQSTVIDHLHAALQGALSRAEIQSIVKSSTQHSGILGLIGFLGVLWGGSNVGGSLSTAFQAIFEVQGRSFVKEKLLDIGMIFVFTALLLLILAGTTAGALLNRLFSALPLSGEVEFVIGTAISLIAAFLLFATIYVSFPNIQPRFKLENIWPGALTAAVLFTILSFVWPIYAHFSHFQRYGAVLFPLLVLSAWIYFFSMITMVGAEIVAVASIRQANRQDRPLGPLETETVPQHRVLRDQDTSEAGSTGGRQHTNKGPTEPEHTAAWPPGSVQQPRRDSRT